MANFIKLTDWAGAIDVYVNVDGVFSMYRQPGAEATVIKGHAGAYDKVKESPEDIFKIMQANTGYHPG